MSNTGSTNNAAQAALEAAAAARRAALEAAAAKRRAEQARQAEQAKKSEPAKPSRPMPVADASSADGEAHMKGKVMTGRVPLPPAPGGAGTGELMAAMADMAPPSKADRAADFVKDLKAKFDGKPADAAAAIMATLVDPGQFQDALGQLKGSDALKGVEADVRAVAGQASLAGLTAALKADPDLSHYPEDTVKQLAGFREVKDPALQSAIDTATRAALDHTDADKLSPELAYLANTSTDSGLKDALASKVKAYADDQLKSIMKDKEKEDGVKDGLKEFQDKMVDLAKQTGLGDVVQKAAEDAVEDGKGEIEDAAERGRSLWDKFTGAIGGLVEDVFGGIGDVIKEAVGGIGDVAGFVGDKIGDVAEAGFDLGAAGLDAVGAHGAADAARKAGDFADKAADTAGQVVKDFDHGIGDALGDTVEGIGTIVAHPIQTVQGLGHLATHPGEIVKLGKALWETAKGDGGYAHAAGYIVGNLLPAVLTGGSTEGAALGGRFASIIGESRVLTTLSTAAEASRVGQIAVKGAEFASKGISAIAESRLGQTIGRAGELAGKARVGATTFVRESRFGRLTASVAERSRIPQVLERVSEAKRAFNGRVDRFLGNQVRKLDGTALGRGIERALPDHVPQTVTVEERLAARAGEAARGPIELRADAEGVIKQRGADGDAIYQNVEPKAAAREPRALGDIPRERGLHREPDAIQRLKPGDRLQGTAHRGGTQPDIVAALDGQRFQETIGRQARAIGKDPTLTAEQKLQQVNELVNSRLTPNFEPDEIARLDEYHAGFIEGNRPLSTEDYLADGLADCRGYAVIHQMALQEAGFQSGIAVSKTALRDLSGPVPPGLVREADGLSHYYNVVQVDGKQLIADAFNPAASGNELADALLRGFVDRNGNRVVQYSAGNYGATILNDGLGAPISGATVATQVVAAEENQRSSQQ